MSLPTAEETENIEEMEKQFAVKAVEQLETYWSLLKVIKGSNLRLTKFDDEIYEHFKQDFPEVDIAETIDEDTMKSKEGKERWRKFLKKYEDRVEDHNFGTMLRSNAKSEYGQDNTLFAVRMQFYAYEVARNRAGLNDWVYEQNHLEENKAAS